MANPLPLHEIEIQIHYWPWSIEIAEETVNVTGGEIKIPFFGSPVITLSQNAKIFIPSRMEQLRQLGACYDNKYVAYETPHGILAGNVAQSKLRCKTTSGSFDVLFKPAGAYDRYINSKEGKEEKIYSKLASYIDSWAQIFDELLEVNANDQVKDSNEVLWSELLEYLEKLKSEKAQPKQALIVKIAKEMRKSLPILVSTLRRILVRERNLVPINRMQETDPHCLRWYIRQPGKSVEEKAGNKQKLLAVVRNPFFNTLENQVLKDFVRRCLFESNRYIQLNTKESLHFTRSKRVLQVQGYKNVCFNCMRDPTFDEVKKPPFGMQPNYVLQNDSRYREIWKWYRKLIKHEFVEDSLWDWQSRTFADIVRLLVSAALERMFQNTKNYDREGNIKIEPLVEAPFQIKTEQESGSRITPGTLPGPFSILLKKGQLRHRSILELVHAELAQEHKIVKHLGRMGGSLYFVFHHITKYNNLKNITIIWCVNGAGSKTIPGLETIAESAFKALNSHRMILNRRMNFPKLSGMVFLSTLQDNENIHFLDDNKKCPLVTVNADPSSWINTIKHISQVLEANLTNFYE